jgi:hypothetical protein
MSNAYLFLSQPLRQEIFVCFIIERQISLLEVSIIGKTLFNLSWLSSLVRYSSKWHQFIKWYIIGQKMIYMVPILHHRLDNHLCDISNSSQDRRIPMWHSHLTIFYLRCINQRIHHKWIIIGHYVCDIRVSS